MYKFLLNPLSANAQFHTIDQAYVYFSKVIDCIKYIWPMIGENRATIYVDPSVYARSLIAGRSFSATISDLRSINGDLSRLWYLYAKNRGAAISNTNVSITVTSKDSNASGTLQGILDSNYTTSDIIWLSFGGLPITEEAEFRVLSDARLNYLANNAHHLISLAPLLPTFKHHTKHGPKPYFDEARKENVAPMPIRDENEAGILLRNGVQCGSDIISYHRNTASIYRFKLTGGNVYHGFIVEKEEITAETYKKITHPPL